MQKLTVTIIQTTIYTTSNFPFNSSQIPPINNDIFPYIGNRDVYDILLKYISVKSILFAFV